MFERLDSRFDVLTEVLEAVHLGSALSSRIDLAAPWGLQFGADLGQRAGFHVVTSGRCWGRLDDGSEPIELLAGDMVIFPHGAGHVLSDTESGTGVVFHDRVLHLRPGERTALPTGGDGVRTSLLCGSYSFAADGMNPLLRGLPQMLHVRPEPQGQVAASIGLLTTEARDPGAGSALLVDRLVDLLFVYGLRAWIGSQQQPSGSSWFGALQDPVVGPAVWAVHDNPAHPWTVDGLARRSGLSRAAFARRFAVAVGEPPLSYVTRWRMSLAADLLAGGERIGRVARQVGYDNEYAFAKAFKRVRGVAPGRHRRRHAG
ncbi:MAG TPA: AraC family transcriptional regulator [Devosia sp.]